MCLKLSCRWEWGVGAVNESYALHITSTHLISCSCILLKLSNASYSCVHSPILFSHHYLPLPLSIHTTNTITSSAFPILHWFSWDHAGWLCLPTKTLPTEVKGKRWITDHRAWKII